MESYFFVICDDSELISSSFGTIIDGSDFDIFSYQMIEKDEGIRVENKLALSCDGFNLDRICCFEIVGNFLC